MDQPSTEKVERAVRLAKILHNNKQLFPEGPFGSGGESWLTTISKALNEGAPSRQLLATGRKAHPADFAKIQLFEIHNPHHSTCLHTKTEATVGLGHTSGSVADALDPLCRISWQDTQNAIAMDFWNTGNGYLEVVRASPDPTSEIRGLYHLPSAYTYINVEDEDANIHFEVSGRRPEVVGGTAADMRAGFMGNRRFAAFGDAARFRERNEVPADGRVSEVIHFRQPSSLNRWYGFPRWIAATASMELAQTLTQERFDFFLNRGVPEFMLWILGAQVNTKDWEKIEAALKAQIGYQNSHKSLAVNLPEPDVTVQLDKLDAESKPDAQMFKDMSEVLALNIVSAHQVPPLLAGILIPGKLGAANELPNAIRAFQLLTIRPAQRIFESVLDCTLGDDLYGIPGLDRGAFAHSTLVDEMDLEMMDVSSRMRQTEPEAQAEGRNLSEGLRRELVDLDDKGAEVIAKVLSKTLERLLAA